MEDPVLSRDDWKRERDVFNLHAAFRDIPHLDFGPSSDTGALPSNFVPRPASDAPLAAFAQLAAFRLGAQRAVISLLDGQYQYILAEATTTTSLRVDSPLNNSSNLYLGTARIHRSWGLCDRVLDPGALNDGDPGIVIIKDLSQAEQYANRDYVTNGPKFRFYAGVPIRSAPNNTIVGSLCILDGPGRTGMSSEEILYLQDLAVTVMEYLDTYTLRDQHRRDAQGLDGLISFAEGDLSMLPSNEEFYSTQLPSRPGPVPADPGEQRSYEEPTQRAIAQPHIPPPRKPSPHLNGSVSDLQDMVLPNTSKKLFARAADIMRKSKDMDGVMFLDASGK
jgi:hypothetical protein